MKDNRPNERHSFDVPLAMVLGVEKAIILKEIAGWCRINEKKAHNIHVGLAWSWNPAKAYASHFPYLSKAEYNCRKKVERLIRELEEEGFIYGHKFNSYRGDHTKSHTVNWPLYTEVLNTGEYSPELATDFIEYLSTNLCYRKHESVPSGKYKNVLSRKHKNVPSYTTPSTTPSSPTTVIGESSDSPEFLPVEEVYLFPAPFQGLDESDLKKKIGPKHLSLLKEGFSNEEFFRAAISMLEDGRFFIYLDWLEYKKKSRKGYTSLSHGLGPLLRTFSGFTEAELRAAYDKSVSNGYSGIFPEKRVASINGQKAKQNGITQICSNETAEQLAEAFVAGGSRW